MKTFNTLCIATLLLALLSSSAVASTNSEAGTSVTSVELSHRSDKKMGAYLGLLGDPHPTVLGLNIAYNALDFMRASIGFGQVSVSSLRVNQNGQLATEETSMTTIGVGSRFFVPGWSFTPTAGVGYSHVFLSSNAVSISDYKANNIYVNAGFDWQATSGFNLGAGMNVSVNGAAPTAPYINLGYFL
ncbi:MAG: hypothetical protein H7333_07930 [Bdellovibrionales bacterium]|nr:hypothetical protein [Oligoflexia bacterium]